ncbi:hypothetical protein [Miltoncostaea marina]|uniref:hypothetical protein n=1 Tax=Miltoncostaea marina TaxID=2843215 RepID=UPI001C3E7AC1|nr:hypothetical protein [Miltoncostaea marina]
MRYRLVILAALVAGAAYVVARERRPPTPPGAERWPRPAPAPAPGPLAGPAAARPAAVRPAADEPAALRLAVDESAAAAAPARAVRAAGRFSAGGWAAAAGHWIPCGVTFPARAEDGAEVADIRLHVEAACNVAEGGLVVLGDPGFAPDGEGFTLVVAAAGSGGFAASGRYELLAPGPAPASTSGPGCR